MDEETVRIVENLFKEKTFADFQKAFQMLNFKEASMVLDILREVTLPSKYKQIFITKI